MLLSLLCRVIIWISYIMSYIFYTKGAEILQDFTHTAHTTEIRKT